VCGSSRQYWSRSLPDRRPGCPRTRSWTAEAALLGLRARRWPARLTGRTVLTRPRRVARRECRIETDRRIRVGDAEAVGATTRSPSPRATVTKGPLGSRTASPVSRSRRTRPRARARRRGPRGDHDRQRGRGYGTIATSTGPARRRQVNAGQSLQCGRSMIRSTPPRKPGGSRVLERRGARWSGRRGDRGRTRSGLPSWGRRRGPRRRARARGRVRRLRRDGRGRCGCREGLRTWREDWDCVWSPQLPRHRQHGSAIRLNATLAPAHRAAGSDCSASQPRWPAPCSRGQGGAASGCPASCPWAPGRRVRQRPAPVLGATSTHRRGPVYLESFGNPHKFARIARELSRDKPIVRSPRAGRPGPRV